MNKKILIIGGCGYIGSRLYLELQKFFQVQSLDLEWFGNPGIENIKQDYKDITKQFLVSFDIIILLAGHGSAKMCEKDPLSTHYNNVSNFLNLLDKLDNQKFIYASSCSVYGNVQYENISEEFHTYHPINYYDLSKKQIDLYAVLSSVEYYGLRFGTVCGASPNWRNDIMMNAMYDTYKKENKIKIFNDVFRPILGINDLASSITTIIKNKSDKRGLYNLASFNLPASKIAYEIAEILGCPTEIITDVKNIINTKLQSSSYNFTISSDKFIKTFGFEFQDNVGSIIKDISVNYDSCNRNRRSELKYYRS